MFHEIQFPTDISRGSTGGPRRLTQVVTLRSGFEERNTIWANSRRSYNAGIGLRNLDDVYTVLEFFEGRRGRLHGFRWKDWSDYKSGKPDQPITPTDVIIGTGNNIETEFQLMKEYSGSINPYTRIINKPVLGTVVASINSTETTQFTVDYSTGILTFNPPPGNNQAVTVGFEFDVPVRFDIDNLNINVEQFNVGAIPDIEILEIRI